MSRWALLSVRQREILTWISEECPEGIMQGSAFKATAVALQDRRLVSISRRGGEWSATITDSGRFYLENDDYPEDLKRRWGAAPRRPKASKKTAAAKSSGEKVPSSSRGLAGLPSRAAGEQMLRDIREAGGTLTIESPSEDLRGAYRRAIHAVKQHSLLATGERLLHTGRAQGDLVLRIAAEGESETDWNRIRLNARRRTTDPDIVMAALERDSEGVVQLSDALRERAIRLIHRLAVLGLDVGDSRRGGLIT